MIGAMAPSPRRQPDAPAGSEPEGIRARRPHAGLLRRERRELLTARDELIRKLGGLSVEMYRRNDRRDDLLTELCAQVVGIDERVVEIDTLLATRREAR